MSPSKHIDTSKAYKKNIIAPTHKNLNQKLYFIYFFNSRKDPKLESLLVPTLNLSKTCNKNAVQLLVEPKDVINLNSLALAGGTGDYKYNSIYCCVPCV
jgi:hypothetical protein